MSNWQHREERRQHEAQLTQTVRLRTKNPQHPLLQSPASLLPSPWTTVGFMLLQPLRAWAAGPSAKHTMLKTTQLRHQTRHGFKRWWKGKAFKLRESAAQLYMQGWILMLLGISAGLPCEARHYQAGITASKSSPPSIWPQPSCCHALAQGPQ